MRDGVDYYPTKSRDPIGHGTKIFELLSYYLPDAEFRCYRIIGGWNRENRTSDDFLDAMKAAREDGIDILNVSSGFTAPTHPGSITQSEINNIVRRGFCVVSSTGNFLKGKVTAVTFPAAAKKVVGVGGYEPLCRCDPESVSTRGERRRYSFVPQPISDTPSSDNVYCGYTSQCLDCSKGTEQCRLSEEQWKGNVEYDENLDKPDLYCPVRYPTLENGNLRMKIGTSYAAPVATAVVGRVLHEISDTRNPSGKEICQKLKDTGTPLTSDTGRKPDAESLLTSLLPDQSQNPFVSE